MDVVDGSIILDRTLLYPEGGGQPADHGTLEKGDRIFRVVDVQKSGDVVLHKLEKPGGLENGDRITGRVDMRRRLAHARHHTATHLVHDSAKRVLGKHIWQAGAQKSEDRARLDISHYKRITDLELKAIELEANRRVMEVTPIETQFLPRTEAEKLFGFELYQGGVPPGTMIRVVKVGSDIEACAGTHVTNTGMIGSIKILRAERIQDGVERIEFAAGEAAVRASQGRDDLLSGAADILRVPGEQLPKTAERFFGEWKSQQKEIERLKEDLAKARLKTMTADARMRQRPQDRGAEDGQRRYRGALESCGSAGRAGLRRPAGLGDGQARGCGRPVRFGQRHQGREHNQGRGQGPGRRRRRQA